MKDPEEITNNKNNTAYGKILLGLLPYWSPLIPPMGIACLKSFLQRHGYQVNLLDLNVEAEFKLVYDDYFSVLSRDMPPDKMSNFHNIGHDVMQDHLMACLHYDDENAYIRLVKALVFNAYYVHIEDSRVLELNKIVVRYYSLLEKHFSAVLEKEQPALLGLSVYRGTLPASLFVFRLTKEKYPHIKTLMGGAVFSQSLEFGSPNLELLLKKAPYIDTFLIGEGENLFLSYLEGKLPGDKRVYTLADINGATMAMEELDIPDFSGLHLDYYPMMASYSSRSCPFQCTFCAETIYWGKYRKKSAAQIVREMDTLAKKHNSRLFLMCDSLLNPVMTNLAKEFIEADLPIYWDGYLRADKEAASLENTMLWRRGGFYRARLGIESGSQRVLDLMNKKVTTARIKEVISYLAHAGIKTTTYWIVGYPGESEKDFKQTLDLIEELKDDIYEAECNHFRYFLSGQVSSREWAEENKCKPMFTKEIDNMLIVQTWHMSSDPTREEVVRRVNRFVAHCKRLGIPNPYSLHDIYQADSRWKKLQKNAVPSLVEFEKNEIPVNPCKHTGEIGAMAKKIVHDENWGF